MNDTLEDAGVLARVQALYTRQAELICDDEIEQWPALFAEQCLYRVVSRVNHDRKLPLAVILAESRGALIDRVTAIRNTMVFAPRAMHHTISGVRVLSRAGDTVRSRSHFVVHQTLGDGETHLQTVGRSFDAIDLGAESPLFAERIAVFDTELFPGSLVYPI